MSTFNKPESYQVYQNISSVLRAGRYAEVETMLASNIEMLRRNQDDVRFLFFLTVYCPAPILEKMVKDHYAQVARQESYKERIAYLMQAIDTNAPFDSHLTPDKIEVLKRNFSQ